MKGRRSASFAISPPLAFTVIYMRFTTRFHHDMMRTGGSGDQLSQPRAALKAAKRSSTPMASEPLRRLSKQAPRLWRSWSSGTHTAQVTPVSFIVMVGTPRGEPARDLVRAPCGQAAQERSSRPDVAHTLSGTLSFHRRHRRPRLRRGRVPMADPIMALLVTGHPRPQWACSATGPRTSFRPRAHSSADIAHVAEKVDGVRSIHAVRTRGTEAEVYW